MFDSLLIWLEGKGKRLNDVEKHGLKNLLMERNPIKLRTVPRRNTNGLVFVYAWRSKYDFRIVGIFLNRSTDKKELKFIEDEIVELDDYLVLYNEWEDKKPDDNLKRYNCGKNLGPSPFQYIDQECTRNILKDCYSQQMKETTKKKLDQIIKASGLGLAT